MALAFDPIRAFFRDIYIITKFDCELVHQTSGEIICSYEQPPYLLEHLGPECSRTVYRSLPVVKSTTQQSISSYGPSWPHAQNHLPHCLLANKGKYYFPCLKTFVRDWSGNNRKVILIVKKKKMKEDNYVSLVVFWLFHCTRLNAGCILLIWCDEADDDPCQITKPLRPV